jgi:hypothetical protein
MNLPAIIVAAFVADALASDPNTSGALTAVSAAFRPYASLNPPTPNPPHAPPSTSALTTIPFNPSSSPNPKSFASAVNGALHTAVWYPKRNAPTLATTALGNKLGPTFVFHGSTTSGSSSGDKGETDDDDDDDDDDVRAPSIRRSSSATSSFVLFVSSGCTTE